VGKCGNKVAAGGERSIPCRFRATRNGAHVPKCRPANNLPRGSANRGGEFSSIGAEFSSVPRESASIRGEFSSVPRESASVSGESARLPRESAP